MKNPITGIILFAISLPVFAQNTPPDTTKVKEEYAEKIIPETPAFLTTKLVNAQTIQQIKKGQLDLRISHRFGDMAGKAGGTQTLYGFDNIADIRIAFDYGITDKWCVGIGRSKGAYQMRQIIDLSSKYNILSQKKGGSPLSLSAFADVTVTTMPSSADIYSVTYYADKFVHRINYSAQLIIARKISNAFSLELLPTYVHRNYVHYTDRNSTFALGIGGRVKFSKRMAIIFDYFQVFDSKRTPKYGYYSPLGVGLEIETHGHVFHLLFSNNKGLLESQYLTENKSNWLSGEFRLGFNISRIFNLIRKKTT